MKSLTLAILILFAFTSLLSCGPSAEEIQKKQQAILDSVARATEEKVAQRINEEKLEKERQFKLEQERIKREDDKKVLKGYLAGLDIELEVQKQKLEDIRQPKFLRTVDEKEIEIRYQLIRIQKIRSKMEEVVALIYRIDSGEQYDLQNITVANRSN